MTPHGTIIQDYPALIAALADRRRDLKVTQFELDQRAGLQDGYTGKIESWAGKSGRGIGPLVLPLLLQSLGVVLMIKPLARPKAVVVCDAEQVPLPLAGGGMNRLAKDLYHRRYNPLKDNPKIKKAC